MTDASTQTPTQAEGPQRLAEFQREVDALKVTGGKANPERNGMIVGGILMVAAILVGLWAYFLTSGSLNSADWADGNALGNLAIVLGMVGATLFFLFGLRRYLRYWLIRVIYELRGANK